MPEPTSGEPTPPVQVDPATSHPPGEPATPETPTPEQLQAQVAELQAQRDAANAKLSEAQSKVTAANKEAADRRKALQNAAKEKGDYEALFKGLESEHATLQTQVAELESLKAENAQFREGLKTAFTPADWEAVKDLPIGQIMAWQKRLYGDAPKLPASPQSGKPIAPSQATNLDADLTAAIASKDPKAIADAHAKLLAAEREKRR